MLPHLRNQHSREDGFTLIELLIVVLIIGILAAIAIPVYLGIQDQAHKSATKQATNSAVTSVQVALTEGQTITQAKTNLDGKQGETTISVTDTSTGTASSYTLTGTNDSGYTYTYDSTTGKFTEGTADINLGGGAGTSPTITSATPTNTGVVGTAYTYTVTANGTPAPTYRITSGTLPTGLTLGLTSGVISGTPSTAGTYTYTLTASNNVGNPATQNGTITISNAVLAGTNYTFETNVEGFTNADQGAAVPVRTTTRANSGTASMRIPVYNGNNAAKSPVIPLTTGTAKTCTVTGYVYNSTTTAGGLDYGITMNYNTSSVVGNGMSYKAPVSGIPAGTWTKVSYSYAAPATATGIYLIAFSGNTADAYWDDINLNCV